MKIAVIGYGVAGFCLEHALHKMGIACHVYDSRKENSSSRVSSGIINPITGRQFNLSWNFDTLWTHLKDFYTGSEYRYFTDFFYPQPIYRALKDITAENVWHGKYHTELASYAADQIYSGSELGIDSELPFVKIHGARLDVEKMLLRGIEKLNDEGRYFRDHFNLKSINALKKRYDHIILATGIDHYFQALPGASFFNPNLGTVIKVKHQKAVLPMIKEKYFTIPLSVNETWVGSINSWSDQEITQDVATSHLEKLKHYFNTKYPHLNILNTTTHSAFRPTVKDRRPIVGKIDDGMWILNGLGTKGCSLAPWLATALTQKIINQKRLDKTIDINRIPLDSG